MPDWAVTEIRERGRRAWASLDLEECRVKAEAEEKAEQKNEWEDYCVEQRAFIDEMIMKNEEEKLRLEEVTDSGNMSVKLRGREREKGLMRPKQQKKPVMEKENIHAGLSRFILISASCILISASCASMLYLNFSKLYFNSCKVYLSSSCNLKLLVVYVLSTMNQLSIEIDRNMSLRLNTLKSHT